MARVAEFGTGQPGSEGLQLLGDGEVTTVFEASEKYLASKTPLVVIAGKA